MGLRPAEQGRLGHLPALDGLRALAVVAVVAYHLELPGAGGGFLGVDLFFVISGFLITTLLLREHASTGRIDLMRFWNRRFRRLVPPLVVMTAAVLSATRVWGVPEQWSSIRGDAVAALAYVANWRFIIDEQSYFETLFAPSPLRHTWSLAIEEQWYLIWPLIVLLLAPVRDRRAVIRALIMMSIAAVVSAGSMWLGHDPADPSDVYYATHTRAQQLLVGAALAWWLLGRPERAARREVVSHRVVGTVSLVGFVALVPIASDRADWLYHGGFLLVSIWCAVLVHAVATVDGGSLPGLAAKPLRSIGERSYAIYLWHWPVIVFVGPPMGIDWSRPALVVLQLAIVAVLVETTHRLVERPLRNRPLDERRAFPWRTTSAWTAAAVVIIVMAPVVLRPPDDRVLASVESIRPSAVAPAQVIPAPTPASSSVPAGSTPVRIDIAVATTAPTTTLPPPPRRMLLFGDSTALAVAVGSTISPAIAPGWFAEAHATLGCGITPGGAVDVDRTEPTAGNEQCVDWVEEWTASAALFEPDVSVVMIGSWEVLDHLVDGAIIRYPESAWAELITSTIREAISVARGPDGSIPVVIVELPCMEQEPNDVFSAVARNDRDRVAAFNAILRQIAATDPLVRTVEVADLYCADGVPIDEVDGSTLRYDGVHVTPFGADLTWRWLAERADELFPIDRPAR